MIFHLQMDYRLAQTMRSVRDGDDGRRCCWHQSKAKERRMLDGQGQTNVLLWRREEAQHHDWGGSVRCRGWRGGVLERQREEMARVKILRMLGEHLVLLTWCSCCTSVLRTVQYSTVQSSMQIDILYGDGYWMAASFALVTGGRTEGQTGQDRLEGQSAVQIQ